RSGRAGESVVGAQYVVAHEVTARAPVPDVSGRVECVLAPMGALANGVGIGDVAVDGLGAATADGLGGPIRSHERPHAPALAAEALDEPPADEARASGHERRCGHTCTLSSNEGMAATDTAAPKSREERINAQRRALPDAPGVYLFRGQSRRVLYVGTAKSIKKRVAGHFSNPSPRRAGGLIDQIAHTDAVATET